ncbi:MAG: YebB family permuted papain-like enzyme [Burkholderiaceae bacterium]
MAINETDQQPIASQYAATTIGTLATSMKVGDIVFIRVSAKPFREVADATNSWTNHVGIVIDTNGAEPLIGESTFPFSRTTTLSKFIARSEDGRVAVARTKTPLSEEQQQRVLIAANKRAGIFYDTGFNLHSHRQFCSRYVREVLNEATGINVGDVETFATLLAHRPDTNVGFWKVWYFGHIPWERETVTPASLLRSQQVSLLFDGVAMKHPAIYTSQN